MKKKIDLSGAWTLRLDAAKRGIEEGFFRQELEDSICLPATTAQAGKGAPGTARETGYLTETYHFEGYAWFAKELELTEEQTGSVAVLKLERTRISHVWIDDRYVGKQDSFACAHCYDLTGYLTGTKHRLTIMVSNVDYATPGGHMTSPDTQTNWNGILGEISLTFEAEVRISELMVSASAEKRQLDICYTTKCCAREKEKALQKGRTLQIVCEYLGQGTEKPDTEKAAVEKMAVEKPGTEKPAVEVLLACETSVDLTTDGRKQIQVEIPGERKLHLWNEYAPNLYRVTLRIGESSAETIVGFRDLHTRERSFYLNELQIMLRGKHDGLIFPLTGYAPMDKAQWREVFGTAKEYGINHYRFHTCCPPEAAFAAADELGMYLAPELPFWGTVAGENETEAERTGREFLLEEGFRILREFGNHPSFLIFSLGNELWGNKQVLNEILEKYKACDARHWYVQGSNNFQWFPEVLPHDDFFCGVRFTKERRFRGSYAMCDAPQGHVQVTEPENCYSYDPVICPQTLAEEGNGTEEVEIQYQTGVRKVTVEKGEEVIPHVPVVSHEIGQYEIYPDYREIAKYTGVLQPENLRIFRERLAEKGMLHKAGDFFRASGHLAIECYKRELETAFRSRELSGFQLLDLQDFTGQGTALVGILNAFMENKGLIRAEEWREFCNDRVIQLRFPGYVYRAGDAFDFEVLLCSMRPEPEQGAVICVRLADRNSGEVLQEVRIDSSVEFTRWKNCGSGSLRLPSGETPRMLTVSVNVAGERIPEGSLTNHYDIYVYPDVARMDGADGVLVTAQPEEMLAALRDGKKVLFFGGSLRDEATVPGTYCTDFWCYPMFASISESMGKPLPVGTMGLCMEKTHPALSLFPNDGCTTPQWWKIVTDARIAVLDELEIEPIVWMIDNFERNHRLGLLYEARVGAGSLLVCQPDLTAKDCPEAVWLYNSLLNYMQSDAFAPKGEIAESWLVGNYIK